MSTVILPFHHILFSGYSLKVFHIFKNLKLQTSLGWKEAGVTDVSWFAWNSFSFKTERPMVPEPTTPTTNLSPGQTRTIDHPNRQPLLVWKVTRAELRERDLGRFQVENEGL